MNALPKRLISIILLFSLSLLQGCSGGGLTSTPTDNSTAGTTTAKTYTVSGTLNGLTNGASVVITNSTANATTISANGSFAFSAPVAANGSYAVAVFTQPDGETCTVSNGSGTNVVANVSDITVTCSTHTFSISGSVSGLAVNQSLVLTNNDADPITIGASGQFSFTTPIAYNSSYAVIVKQQPAGQVCTVTNGFGAGVVANISNVSVVCSTNTYTISGRVTGLNAAQQVSLLNNGGNALAITANGQFSFTTPVAYNGSYTVTIGQQPTLETCTVSNNTGAGVVAHVSNILVTCSTASYTITGTVSGLTASQQVTLLNNSSDPVVVSTNGSFTFSSPVAANSSYTVTVNQQPTGQTCTVTNGSGSGVVANITNVNVTCSSETFTISATVSGLTGSVTFFNNGSNATPITQNGSFTFSVPVVYGTAYSVTVDLQPTGQTCTVSNGSGSNLTENVSNVSVLCATATYTISGTVTGMSAGDQVTLNNNGGDATTVTSNTTFTFATGVTGGSSYAVTVGTQPIIMNCTVGAGTGSNVSVNVTGVTVTCGVASEAVFYTFTGPTTDGATPQGGLILGSDGNYYGTTKLGGANNAGTVFQLSPSGTKTIIHSFAGGTTDGSHPYGTLTADSSGNLYGTTFDGGSVGGYGTIFTISNLGAESILHSFTASEGTGSANGNSLIMVGSTLYGVSSAGGGNGTLYSVNPTNGNLTVLHTFAGGADGATPSGALVASSGNVLYGTTSLGGTNSVGTIYSYAISGSSYNTLYSFGTNANDGTGPQSGMIIGVDGNLYGTAAAGGTGGNGAVYKYNLTTSTESVVYRFTGGSDGCTPLGGLYQGSDNNFYGTTSACGTGTNGTIFQVIPGTSETPLYSFSGSTDGAHPNYGSLILGADGNLYGMTSGGGATYGTVFKY